MLKYKTPRILWTDVVWGNHDAIDQRLAGLGETRALTEWFERWIVPNKEEAN